MAKRFFIIDGLGQIFRCYYAPFQRLTAPGGEPTRATYVFCNMLLQLLREQQPDYLAVAMDSDESIVFRRQIYPEYKANREPPPEELAPQITRILQIVRVMHVPVLSVPGFEADDVMATLCHRLSGRDLEIVLVSKDKDLDQLLSERVRLFDPAKNEFIGPQDIQEKKGYAPAQAVEVQTLSGDTTDNIPGIRGVGAKKAAELIARYGSAAAVIAHADQLTPALGRNVRAFAEQLETARQLVALRRDVPVAFDLEACRWVEVDYAALKPIFAELGFRRLLEQAVAAVPGEPPPAAEASRPAARDYVLVDEPAKFTAFLGELTRQSVFAFDTETTSLNAVEARLVGMSFCWQANRAFYLPVAGVGQCLPLEPTLAALRPILADPRVAKVGQNIKYDLVVLNNHDVPVKGVAFDTMIASFVLDSTRHAHGLDALARELLGIETIPITALIGKGKNQIGFDSVDTARACTYAAEDADVTWQLYEVLGKQLAGSDLESLFRETEMPLVEVLAAMESAGVRIDPAVLAEIGRGLAGRLAELTRQIYQEAGHAFNLDSTRELAAVLFDELHLPVVRKTKTGRSTDAETLETLAGQSRHPLPALVKEYRELSKLKSTYVDTLPQMICRRTGRIHAGFHQTGAITGRLSSSEPNLQNIPIRTELGRQIRRAFVAGDAEHVLLTADYSQIELRVLAHFSQDEALKRAFAEDRDIHQFVAAQVFGVPLEQVSKEQRGRAKAVNFGIIYGQSAYGLSRTTGLPVGEAQNFINMYFMRYPGIRLFFDRVIAQAERDGCVRTILGRRRMVPDLQSRHRGIRQAAERLAVNTVLQGSAADLIKRAMVNIHRRIVAERRAARLLIQVHDELVFDVPREAAEAEGEFIRREMCTALKLDVPLKVDLAWGDNWLEGK